MWKIEFVGVIFWELVFVNFLHVGHYTVCKTNKNVQFNLKIKILEKTIKRSQFITEPAKCLKISGQYKYK